MHILTGMLIAGLLGKGRAPSLLPMLRTGPVRTAHAMPGRIRFRVPSLENDPSRGAFLREKLATLGGVQSITVTPQTGSVLVRYEEGKVRAELLFAAIVRLLGLDGELNQTPQPSIVKELRSLMDSLNRVVYDRTGGLLDFTSAVSIVLGAVGIQKLVSKQSKAMPAGLTLLWWAFHQLMTHEE
jgi:hypothetical protein